MPGPLFQYINFFHIKVKKTVHSTSETLGLPSLGDLEWERARAFMACRGFSGFSGDDRYHCIEAYRPYRPEGGNVEVNPHPQKKIYVPAMEYLERNFPKEMGKPLFENQAKHYMEFGGRDSGKSYWMANLFMYNLMTDGLFDYDRWLEEYPTNSSVTVTGSESAEYSSATLAKFRVALDNLPGDCWIEGSDVYTPSPLKRSWSGSLSLGAANPFALTYKKRGRDGQFRPHGSGSVLQHITFFNNPEAANRLRTNFMGVDEVGMLRSLKQVIGKSRDSVANGSTQYGTIHFAGTAGKSTPELVEEVRQVFYDPAYYNILPFENLYDHRSKSIAYFISAAKTLNDFRDPATGRIDDVGARAAVVKERERLSKGDDTTQLVLYKQNRPLEPEDCFLLEGGNILSVPGLEDWLKVLEETRLGDHMCGELYQDAKGNAAFSRDTTGRMKPVPWPTPKTMGAGCVQVWEPPIEDAPFGSYAIGYDPYSKDMTVERGSLGSVIVIRRERLEAGLVGEPVVAQWTGRPEKYEHMNEGARLMALWYNTEVLAENNVYHAKDHFLRKRSMNRLAPTPGFFSKGPHRSEQYGVHVHKDNKPDLELLAREWLKQRDTTGNPKFMGIRDVNLLKELKAYFRDGNFDRVSSFFMALLHVNDLKVRAEKTKARETKGKSTIFDGKITL